MIASILQEGIFSTLIYYVTDAEFSYFIYLFFYVLGRVGHWGGYVEV